MYMSKKNKEEYLNKAVSAGATRNTLGKYSGHCRPCPESESAVRVCSVHTVPTPTQRAEGRGSTMYYAVPLFQPGGRKEDRPVLHGLSVCPRASASHRYLTATRLHHLSVGSSVCRVLSVRVPCPMSILLRSECPRPRPPGCRRTPASRDRPGHLHAQHTSTPTLPRVHRAAPRPHRPIEHTARHDRNEARQPCPTPDSTPCPTPDSTPRHTRRLRTAKISNHHRASAGDPFDAPEESDSPLLPNLNACAHTALTTGVCRP